MHSYKIVEKGTPLEKASKALILLHGRGGTAEDILGLAKALDADSYYIAAPQATMNTWYPYSFLADEASNEPWLSSAVNIVKRLIDETSHKIPLSSIYVMGFSQGACLAVETTARFPALYGGVAAFTGGLIGRTLDPAKYKGDFAGTKIFMGNSDIDPHVPLSRSEETKAILEKLGAEVTLKVYPGMAHTINQDELAWVKSHLLNQTSP